MIFQVIQLLACAAFSGADKDYIVQISGKNLILSIVPETYSLVRTT